MDPNPFRPPIEEELLSGARLEAATEPRLALRGNRFGAALIDQIAIAFGSFGATYLVGMAFHPAGALKDWLEVVIGFAVSCFVQILLLRDGQSIGKRMTNIRIVDYATGRTASVGRILAFRIVPLAAVSYMSWYAAEWLYPGELWLVAVISIAITLADVLPIFGGERRCLHDYLAGTKVVEVRP